jgi:hypothetical protein
MTKRNYPKTKLEIGGNVDLRAEENKMEESGIKPATRNILLAAMRAMAKKAKKLLQASNPN